MTDEIVTIVSFISGIVGIIWFLWYIYEKKYPIRRLSWKVVEKATQRIVEQMAVDGFSPTLIVGIGRGGAIMGALVSGYLGHRPLLVIDRKYIWKEGRRIDDMLLHLRLPPELIKNVLLIAGEVHTGNTMRTYYNYFKNIGSKQVFRATFYYQEGCTEHLEYIGLKSSKNLILPWMISKNYVRESLSEEEEKKLQRSRGTFSTSSEIVAVCYIVRHGESADNASGDRYSGITDSPLTKQGLQQAEDVGHFLEEEHIDRIYTSPMKRAIETARIIQSITGGEIIIDRRLREMDYGEWEGLTREEVSQRWPELYSAYKEDPIKNYPPNGEDPKETLERILDLWGDIKIATSSESVSKIILVTHKSIGRLLLCYISGKPLSKYKEVRFDNGSITKVVIDKLGNAKIEYENKTDHLSSKV
jgi:probable phosphoglycerate mutase